MVDQLVKYAKQVRERVAKFFERRPDPFLARMQQQCELNIDATQALLDYLEKPSKKNARRVRELEQEADEVRRMLVDELNRTFVTPIDREDIHALSRAIDDILDDAWFTINEMDILDVPPNAHLVHMAKLLYQGATEIKLAMERLEKHPNVATTHAIRAHAVNNEMETLYAEALADLFQSPKNLKRVVYMLKLREIYRHLFHAAGRIDDAANHITDIVVKFYA